MGNRAAKTALFDAFARAAKALASGRRIELLDVLANGERTTTIGTERRHNRLLAAPNEDAFVAQLLASFGSYPPYFLRLRERNRVGPELLGRDWKVLPLLSTDKIQQHLAGGGLVVDTPPHHRLRGRPHPRSPVNRTPAPICQLAGLAAGRHPTPRLRP